MKAVAASIAVVFLALSGTARAQGGISRDGWTQIGPSGGAVSGLAIDPTNPSRMFLATRGGGIWKSVDEGSNWAPVDDYLASLVVNALVYHPRNPQIMYAATGSASSPGVGVIRSLDGGQTWGLLPQTAGLDFSAIDKVVLSPDGGVMLAVTRFGLLRTTDGGATWTKVVSRAVTDAAFLPSGSAVAAGSSSPNITGSGVCEMSYSNNAGAIWSPASGVTGGPVGYIPGTCQIGVSTTSSSVVYLTQGQTDFHVSFSQPGPTLSYVSVDGGITYTSRTPPTSEPVRALWVDPADANVVIVGGAGLYRSTDAGVTWSSTLAPASAGYAQIVPDPRYDGTSNRRVYVATNSGVYSTDDVRSVTPVNGAYVARNGGLALGNFDGATTGAGSIFAEHGSALRGVEHGGVLRGAPSGGTWTWTTILEQSTHTVAVDPTDPARLYAMTSAPFGPLTNSLYRTADGGATWDVIATRSGSIASPDVAMDPHDPNTLLYLSSGQVYRTNNARAPVTSTTPAWTLVPSACTNFNSTITIAPSDSSVLWVACGDGGIYASADGAATSPTFTRLTGLPAAAPAHIVFDPSSAQIVYVLFAAAGGNIWKTTDGGATWAPASGSGATALPAIPVYALAIDPRSASYLYAGTSAGVFSSRDGGATWSASSQGPANVRINDLFWMDHTLVAATAGRGIFTTEPTTVTLVLDDPHADEALGPSFKVRGWAFDPAAPSGTGVDAVHVYAYPNPGSGAPPIFLGVAPPVDRPEIGAIFGPRATASGFELNVPRLAPGPSLIVVYAHNTLRGAFETSASAPITVTPPAAHPSIQTDEPGPGATVGPTFHVSGWALDDGDAAASDTGIDAVHVYAVPQTGGAATFLGVAEYGLARADVGAIFGARFVNTGYALTSSTPLAPGAYILVVYARSAVSGQWFWQTRAITVRPPGDPLMTIDIPSSGAGAGQPFQLAGWAIDRDAATGPGVDALHVWAYPLSGGSPIFAGTGELDFARGDIGAIFGSQFTNSGYNITVSGLPVGQYQIVVYAHSTVTGTFNQSRVVTVTVP